MRRAASPSKAPHTGRAGSPGQAPPRRRRPVWRCLGIIAKLVATLLVLLVLGAGVLAVRLHHGPVSVSFLTPYIEDALTSPDLAVAIADTTIELDNTDRTLDIVASNTRLRDRSGELLAVFPNLELSLSLAAALKGLVAPTRVVLREPWVHLVRERDGSFSFALGGDRGQSETVADRLLTELAGRPNPESSWGHLREVIIRDAVLAVDDRLLGVSWQTRRAAMLFLRGQGGIEGAVWASADLGDRRADARGRFRYLAAAKRLVSDLWVAGLEPARIADLAPAFAPFAAIAAPLEGTLWASLDLGASRIESARVDLTLGKGAIVRRELPLGSIAVTGGRLRAGYVPALGRVAIETLSLDLGGPRIEASANIDGIRAERLLGLPDAPPAEDIAIDGDLAVHDLPMDELAQYWPESVGHNPREWVLPNIPEGLAEEIRLKFGARLPAEGAEPLLDTFEGTMRYRDLTVRYLDPLPPVRGVSGTGSFDKARLDLAPTSGSLLGIRVTGATVSLTKLDTDEEQIAIDVAIAGPLRDALAVINTPPFGYAREVGLDPPRVAGNAEGRLGFSFPLRKDLKVEDVEIAISSKLSAVAVQKFVFNEDVTEGAFELRLDGTALKLHGGAKLAGTPAAVSLTNLFRPGKDGVRTRYTVWAIADDEARKRLDLDPLPGMLAGPVAVDVSVTERTGKRREAVLALGLKDAALAVDQLAYAKPRGEPAQARLVLEMVDDRITRVRDLTLRGPRLDVAGTILFAGKDNAVQRADIRRLVAGDTNLAGTVERRPEGGWRAEIRGPSLDASGLFKGSGEAGSAPPLTVDARLDRVILGPQREARQVAVQLSRDEMRWQNARVDATLGEKGTLAIRFGQAGGERPFSLATNDFGAALRLFGLSENFVGGQFTASGKAEDAGGHRIFRGTLDGSNYRLFKAPGFAKLLSVASLTSLTSLLSGEGLPFDKLKGEFEFSDPKITLKEVRAYGGAIGLTASGTVDIDSETIDLAGTLVPAYTLNNLLGYIPILGNLLLGGEGQGIFGVNYHAGGSLNDPTITVNPLSALAPGALRRLFLFDAPSGSSTSPTPPAPPQLGGR